MASTETLTTDAERRWSSLQAARPDLGPVIALQRQLMTEQLNLLDRLETAGVAPLVDEPTALDKLARGLPVLRGERIDPAPAILAPALDTFCRHLAVGEAAGPAGRLLDTLESGRLSRVSLLQASLARDREAIQAGATQMSVAPDLLWLVGELATAPLAYLLQRASLTSSSARFRRALQHWSHGYCPACGSWPALAEDVAGATAETVLRCAYCASTWEPPAGHCGYCDASGSIESMSRDADEAAGVIQVCRSCGAYTKRLSVDRPTPFPLLALLDLESMPLDELAARQGYGRPPMVDLGDASISRPGCE